MALTLESEVAKIQGVIALYTEEIPIDFCYKSFCINHTHIIGRSDLSFAPWHFYCHNNQPGTKNQVA
jgi:hypothetical protein